MKSAKVWVINRMFEEFFQLQHQLCLTYAPVGVLQFPKETIRKKMLSNLVIAQERLYVLEVIHFFFFVVTATGPFF